jgi:hypothetical protein
VDLWWSGKHTAHGGNVQVIAAPDGWPLWTSGVRPGREHNTTALRAHTEALPLLAEWTDEVHVVLADLGYEGEQAALTTPIKHRTGRRLTADQRTVNLLHAATRAPAERGNSLLKTTLRRYAGSATALGASARSLPPPWSCSTTNTTALHDQRASGTVTGNGSLCGFDSYHPLRAWVTPEDLTGFPGRSRGRRRGGRCRE